MLNGNFGSGLSASDVLALTNDNNGFGGNSAIWLIIILALLFGWGNNGWGGYGAGGVQENYILTSDFSQLSRQMDMGFDSLRQQGTALANGLSSLGYDQLAQFNNINTNVLQSANALQSQLAQCCCDNREAIAGVNYNMATHANAIQNSIQTGFCQTNYNNATNTRDIVDSQSAGTRAILDKLSQMESSAKDEKIAELQARNSDLRFEASQVAQNSFIQNLVKPPIQPCYVTQNPYCSCGNVNPYGYGYTYGTTIA